MCFVGWVSTLCHFSLSRFFIPLCQCQWDRLGICHTTNAIPALQHQSAQPPAVCSRPWHQNCQCTAPPSRDCGPGWTYAPATWSWRPLSGQSSLCLAEQHQYSAVIQVSGFRVPGTRCDRNCRGTCFFPSFQILSSQEQVRRPRFS